MKRISLIAFTLLIAALCVPQFVAAQQYTAPVGEVFRQEGIASWYGPGFDGRPTASGEIFDSSQFTAAHPDLPFGTFLLVTNRHNNRQVSVRVNDRGPFVASRIIDVSKAAAEYLDMIVTGTAPVTVEILQASYPPPIEALPVAPTVPQVIYYPPTPQVPVNPQAVAQAPLVTQPSPQPKVVEPVYIAPPSTVEYFPYQPATTVYLPPPVASAPTPVVPEIVLPSTPGIKLIPNISPLPGKMYKLQVGSYKDPHSAVNAYVKLRDAGLGPTYERYQDYYRVVLAGIHGTEVQSVTEKLNTAGFHEAVIREDK
jgi:rare lipoprotein A